MSRRTTTTTKGLSWVRPQQRARVLQQQHVDGSGRRGPARQKIWRSATETPAAPVSRFSPRRIHVALRVALRDAT
jgi:hypothetical protein